MSALGLLFLGCALLVNNAAGFYLPGAAPRDYQRGEKVDLLVNALTPMLANEEHAKLVRPQSAPTLEAVLTIRRNRSSTVCIPSPWYFAYSLPCRQMTTTILRSTSANQKAVQSLNRSDLGPSSSAIGYSIPLSMWVHSSRRR